MKEPKYNGTCFECDENLTDYGYRVGDGEDFDGCSCPVCGHDNTYYDGEDVEDWDSVVIRSYHCPKCGSEYTFTYWIKAIVIHKDGRFNKEN